MMDAPLAAPPPPPPTHVGPALCYELKQPRLGVGSFGEVFACVDVVTGACLAVKLERLDARHPQLATEARIMRLLHDTSNSGDGSGTSDPPFPRVIWFGTAPSHHALVMTLLGPSLEALFTNPCGRHFSLSTTLRVGLSLIASLEQLHTRGYLHRDVKPDNIVLPLDHVSPLSSPHTLLIDFGLAKRYLDEAGEHIPQRTGKALTGTARYVSLTTHAGGEQGRRDDLESACYVMLYFLRGSLPWQGLHAETKLAKYNRIHDVKRAISAEALTMGWPYELGVLLKYARNLPFTAAPDYAYASSLLRAAAIRNGVSLDAAFDWERCSRATPLLPLLRLPVPPLPPSHLQQHDSRETSTASSAFIPWAIVSRPRADTPTPPGAGSTTHHVSWH